MAQLMAHEKVAKMGLYDFPMNILLIQLMAQMIILIDSFLEDISKESDERNSNDPSDKTVSSSSEGLSNASKD